MSCPGTPCTPAPTTGSWTFTANPSANRFCGDRLIGLAGSDASAGTNLVAVDPITGCLSRPEGPKGVWQHNPDGCQPDFVGPLDNPEFVNLAGIDATKRHRLPLLESTCGESVAEIVSGDVISGNLGIPAMLRDECCAGGTQWAVMAPEFLINGRQSSAGVCVSPRLLGFVPYERTICPGRTVTEYRWFSMDKWQQAEVADVIDADILSPASGQTQNLWIGAWRTEVCSGGGTVNQLVKINGVQAKRLLADVLPQPSMVHQIPWHSIGTATPDLNATQTLLTFNPATLPGYKAEYQTMWLQTRLVVSSVGADYRIKILIGAQEIHNGIVREHTGPSGDFINPTYAFPFPVSSGNIAITKTLEILGGNDSALFEMEYQIKLVAWGY